MNYAVIVAGKVVQVCYSAIVASCWVTFYTASMGVVAEVKLIGKEAV